MRRAVEIVERSLGRSIRTRTFLLEAGLPGAALVALAFMPGRGDDDQADLGKWTGVPPAHAGGTPAVPGGPLPSALSAGTISCSCVETSARRPSLRKRSPGDFPPAP